MTTTKYCSGCKLELPIDQFRLRMRRGKVQPRSRCRECDKKDGRAYQQKIISNGVLSQRLKASYMNNSERFRHQHIRSFARKLQIQPDKLIEFLKSHKRVCEICGQPESPNRRLDIDHNHETNDIRGLLCSQCNIGIGYLLDKPELLRNAAEYLEKKPAIKSEGKPIPLPESHAASKQALFWSMLNDTL